MFEVHRGVEQGPHFLAAQHRRQFPPHLGPGDLLDHPGSLQRLSVEELQCGAAHPKRRPGELVLLDQMELVLSDVLGTKLIRALVVMPRQVGDSTGVGTDRLRRVIPQTQILDHSLA